METLLETFAMLALLLGITSSGPEWYTTSSIDPIDDTRSAVALRLESPGQWTRAGRHRLLLLFCEEQRPNEKPDIRALVAWNISAEDFSKPVDAIRQDESRTTMGILTRFGDEQAQSWTYERVGKGKELFATIPHDMDHFLKEAKKATEVALRLENEVKDTQTTVFDLTGSARVIEAMESGCRSSDRPSTRPAPPRQDSLTQRRLYSALVQQIRDRVVPCWNPPIGIKDAHKLRVEISIRLNPDGTLIGSPRIVDRQRLATDPVFRAYAESAKRALQNPRCQPLRLPLDSYKVWQAISFNFDTRELLR